jgi:hypothetical protein
MKRLFFAAFLAVTRLHAQSYHLTMTYDRPGLNIPHWQIDLQPHGPGQYSGKPVKGEDPGIVFFALSDAGSQHLADLLNQSHGMQPCETKSKGIANMGQKDLMYAPEGGVESHCSFNFTDNKALSEATEYLIAMANTVQTGLELDRLHRYDRLGLDAVMRRLAADVKEHRAVGIIAIQPTLQRLTEDEAVMERVRARAQELLALAKSEATQ